MGGNCAAGVSSSVVGGTPTAFGVVSSFVSDSVSDRNDGGVPLLPKVAFFSRRPISFGCLGRLGGDRFSLNVKSCDIRTYIKDRF